MNMIHITGIDLNLIRVFHAIMRERNITRAAAGIGLTQPAVSHALRRLRVLTGDPLFVRSPEGMVPTPRAAAMAEGAESLLRGAERLFSDGSAFDPAASARRFTLGLSDYATLVLLPPLLRLARTEAPGVTFVVKNASHGTGIDLVDSGAADLIAGNFPTAPRRLSTGLLYRESFVCAARADHPAVRRRLDLKAYLACSHLQVSTSGEPHGYVDRVLDRRRLRRRVAVTVGYFLAAPALVAGTDLVATEPRRLFPERGRNGGICVVPPPFAIPAFPVVQIWHKRVEDDPGHVWLRHLLCRAAAE